MCFFVDILIVILILILFLKLKQYSESRLNQKYNYLVKTKVLSVLTK